MEGREGGRREAAAERLVDDDLHLVLLVGEGVDVAAVALRDPALAGLVVERAVDLAPAPLGAEVAPTGFFFGVAERVEVADGGGAAAVLRRALAGAARLPEGGEDLDLLDPVPPTPVCRG